MGTGTGTIVGFSVGCGVGRDVGPHGAVCDTPLHMWTGAAVGLYVGGMGVGASVGFDVGTYL